MSGLETEPPAHPTSWARVAIEFAPSLVFFFVSGACGLLYQVVWTRQLALLFGVTHHAVAAVLSIFFLGLAAGSLAGGRWADRARSPLLWYGVCELVIAAWAMLFLAVLHQGEEAVAAILRAAAASRGAGIALRAGLALVLLFVPVVLMGATLPLLSRHVTQSARSAGMRVGLLYSVNTTGAMAGCGLTGFYLLENYGYTHTTYLGAAANAMIGILAIALALLFPPRPRLCGGEERGEGGGAPYTAPELTQDHTPNAPPRPLPGGEGRGEGVLVPLVLTAFSLSGFCFLALEVVWTRLLAIVFLGTTYAYTTMLVVVLLGIALGGALGALIARRSPWPQAWLGACLGLAGFILLLQIRYQWPHLPQLFLDSPSGDWATEVETKLYLAARTLLPVTLLFGTSFPLALQAINRSRAIGSDVGRIYALNTLGGVGGSVAGGFLLLPLLGTQGLLAAMAVLTIAAGLLAALPTLLHKKQWLWALGVLGVSTIVAFPRNPTALLSALNAGYIPATHEILAMREGTEGTVVVSQPKGDTSGSNRVLWINRVQATASIERGVRMNRMQGVLPHLFDRDVNNILFMCFGSGVTCGTLALGGFEHIDAVEISPDVLAVAPLFEADNLGVLNRPGVEFHIDDGRNYLLVSPKQYDFITFEPMPLALAGVSTFYTREYYELCLSHLAPSGMVSQWVPLHALSPDVVRSLAFTFTQVFPHVCAWFINADLFLIGSNEPLVLSPDRAATKLATLELQAALHDAGFPDLQELYACFAMDDPALRAFAQGGQSMSDDRPWAEFIAPRLVYGRTVQDTLAQLQQHLSSPEGMMTASTPPPLRADILRRHRARMHDFEGLRAYYGGAAIGMQAFDAFDASLDIDPAHFNSKYYLKQITLQQGERLIQWETWGEAEEIITRALKRMPEDEALLALRDKFQAAKQRAIQ